MTITHRKRPQLPEEVQVVNEPGLQIQCDSCLCDLTHSIRIKCADPICEQDDGTDICPNCFCSGKEFKMHKRDHAYRVVELHSYPIFEEDWGADEELLLIEGIALQGLGNWQAVSEHVGTRTKEEIEQHYYAVYINSPDWPLPRMNLEFNVDPVTFQDRKRRRISTMTAATLPKPAPTSAPGVHEIATFLPGRLEFEHEIDNEAEDLIKDLEIGICLEYGGDELKRDVYDPDMIARVKLEEERHLNQEHNAKLNGVDAAKGSTNGHISSSNSSKSETKQESIKADATDSAAAEAEMNAEEPVMPPPIETKKSLEFKLTLLEMYNQRVQKRHEAKALMFDRGLLDYKKMQAAEKKRPKDEKEIVSRLRPFAKLQTAQDYEDFVEGILYESALRRRIQELQEYRRIGLASIADVDRFEELESIKKAAARATISLNLNAEKLQKHGRDSMDVDQPQSNGVSSQAEDNNRETSLRPKANNAPAPLFRKQPAPLNLAHSASLHLLTPAEQTLCSTLRILPKPYLVMKETLVREYARRGGKLRRREARDLIKIDVNKTSKIWDFLVQAGFLKVPPAELESSQTPTSTGQSHTVSGNYVTASPAKDNISRHTLPAAPTPTVTSNGDSSNAPAIFHL